jgi:hypothetical protein
MEPCRPRTIQLPLTASPCGRLSRPRSTTSQSDLRPVIRPFSPRRLGRSYKLALEPDGSPLFTLLPLVACWRYEPREHLRPLAIARAAIPPSPLRDGVGYSDHDRFRGYFSVHFIPAYNLPVYASQLPLPDASCSAASLDHLVGAGQQSQFILEVLENARRLNEERLDGRQCRPADCTS